MNSIRVKLKLVPIVVTVICFNRVVWDVRPSWRVPKDGHHDNKKRGHYVDVEFALGKIFGFVPFRLFKFSIFVEHH